LFNKKARRSGPVDFRLSLSTFHVKERRALPNESNVTAPITLLGLGRSGTSLLADSFNRRKDFSNCGETGGFIFGTWEGAKQSFVPHPREYWELFAKDSDAKSAFYVRETLKAFFPSDRPHWFQKPAGLPMTFLNWRALPGKRSPISNFPVEWYWNVFTRSFPDGKFITVIRDPFDVALSRADHSGWEVQDTLKIIVHVYEIIEYGWNNFASIVLFDELVADFTGTMQKVCADLSITFDASMAESIKENHAPAAGRSPAVSHRKRWDELSSVELQSSEIDVFQNTWGRLGRSLSIPDSIRVSG
jgi:hypothetical protein